MQNWHNTAVAWSTIIIALATVLNFVISIFLWRTTCGYTKVTRDIFAASNRPYVGIGSVGYDDLAVGKRCGVILEIKNFGTVPAHNVIVKIKLTANGVEIPATTDFDIKSHTIFPGIYSEQRLLIDDPQEYKQVTNAILSLLVSITYNGVDNKSYSCDCEYARHPKKNAFEIVGSNSA